VLEPSGRWRRFARFLDRVAGRVSRLPRHAGFIATVLIIAASAGYGGVAGGQANKVIDFFRDIRDAAANVAGFRIATVAIDGERHLSREEILAAAGVNGRTSLLFLDVADARARLLTNPWIAEATVQKLLPDRLVISISERVAFAPPLLAQRLHAVAHVERQMHRALGVIGAGDRIVEDQRRRAHRRCALQWRWQSAQRVGHAAVRQAIHDLYLVTRRTVV